MKEQLAEKTKLCEEYNLRTEIMALWSGKGQTLARLRTVTMKCFQALKHYREFKLHAKAVLENRRRHNNKAQARRVFQAWVKSFKATKVQRDKDKFDRQVKAELQAISATYQKEIETLRSKLAEADRQLAINNRNKHMMQENLKKAFMRSVCALNFEAMSILDPAEQNFAQQRMEQELQRQMDNAMQVNNMDYGTHQYPPGPKSEISFNLSEAGDAQHVSTERERDWAAAERDLMQMGLSIVPNNIMQPRQLDENSRKIESKDSMWKPAPVMGREMTTQSYQNQGELTITQKLQQLR